MTQSISEKLETVRQQALAEIAAASAEGQLYQLKSRYTGKKSDLSAVLADLGALSIDEKRQIGGLANTVKTDVLQAIEDRLSQVVQSTAAASFDATAPGIPCVVGSQHPLTMVLDELKDVFGKMGFAVAEGPEVETDYYNFEALNTPKHHPARDMQDTFYVSDEVLLRTHTSPVQVRLMEKQKPPIRAIMPGRVYRNEEISARSYCLFHQMEGLYIDAHVTFADLKGTIDAFVRNYFGNSVKSKFRPSFFPFTEPSAEVDIQCFLCNSKGCPVCKRTGWLEIMGCGMVDPNVFNAVGINPDEWSGFAFGMGIERIAMLKYDVTDIRLFFENDMRFLEQF